MYETHKPTCLFSWDQKLLWLHIAFHTFWASTSQAHKHIQHKETTVNNYKTIFPSQLDNFPFRVSNITPTVLR